MSEVVAVRTMVDDFGWLRLVETIRLTCAHCNEVVERQIAYFWWSNPPMPQHCSPSCAKRAFERRTRERYGKITKARRRAVYERDGWRCCSCGSRDDLTLDHITAKSAGGTNDPSNLQTLCRPCNLEKADT